MDNAERMTIARAYVDASNDHDLDRIATMLAPDVAYRSSGVERVFVGDNGCITRVEVER